MFVWYIFFTDSYYNSPSLAIHLLENPTHLCGTVRSSRKFYCKEIVNVQLEKGTASFLRTSHDQRIIVSKYQAIKDKSGYQQKVVYLLPTCYQAEMIQIGNDHLDNQIFQPTMVKSYGTHMGGADRVDRLLHTIQALRKSYEWYKKLAFRLIMQISLNAFKVFQHHTAANAKFTFLSFLHDAIALMITATPDIPQRLINEPGTDIRDRLTWRHFPSQKMPQEGSKYPTKKSRVCYVKGIKTKKGGPMKTVYVCCFSPSARGYILIYILSYIILC